jgi:NhaP-type Na+/H+ and K+/H+ antiporter
LIITGALYILAAFITPQDYSALALTAIAVCGSLLVVARCLTVMLGAKSQA